MTLALVVFALTLGSFRKTHHIAVRVSALGIVLALVGGLSSAAHADGINWTPRTSAADNGWLSVTWGGPAGQKLFVAVATTGTGNRVMTSPDGITWTSRTSASDIFWRSVTWGGPAGQELFVAVASTGTGNRVMTSSCSTSSTAAAPTISSVTAGDGSLTVSFTAGSDGGSPITNYKYSVDGTTYTALNPATTTSPFSISGLTNGTSYSVTIKAVNANGDSPASNAVAGTPVAPAPTAAGSNTSTTSTTVAATTTTTLSPTVTQPSVEASKTLPATGSDSSPLTLFGVALLATGVLFTARRRLTR